MAFEFSKHSLEQMEIRNISKELVDFILTNPDAIIDEENEQLIYQSGKVSKDYKEEQTRFFVNHLLYFKLGHQPSQILAVRYSFNKKNKTLGCPVMKY